MGAVDTALHPISKRQRMAGDPYFVGFTEREWISDMNDLRRRVIQNRMSATDVARELDLQDIEEAKAFVSHIRKRKPRTRHEALGVPHAFSTEDVYRAAMAQSNPNARVEFNNQGNFVGTDLRRALGELNQYVDVQNRQGDVLSLGYFSNLDPQILPSVLADSTNDTPFRQVIGEILRQSDELGTGYTSDKLFQTSRREGDSGMAKDFLVGGSYRRGDINNAINDATKGGYDFVRPRDIHQVDLSKLRGALEKLTLGDMSKNKIGLLTNRNGRSPDLDKKLKLSLPMDFVNEVARTDGLIDKEIVDYIQRH